MWASNVRRDTRGDIMRWIRCILIFAVVQVAGASVAEHLVVVRDAWINTYHFDNKPLSSWDGGLLLAYESHGMPAAIHAFNRDGQNVLSSRLSFLEAQDIRITDLAAGPNGTIGAAVSVQAGSPGVYLLWLAPNGEVRKIVRTSPFAVYRIVFAADGSLWAAGRIIDHSIHREEDRPAHDVLRKYAPDGTLLQTSLASDSFISRTGQHPTLRPFFSIQHDRVGFYSRTAEEWVEISNEGEILDRWPGLHLDRRDILTGLGFLPNGRVYLSVQQYQGNTRPTVYYTLDKQQGIWTEVDSTQLYPPDSSRVSRIAGTDGNDLVIVTNPAHVHWVRAE